MDQRAGGFEAKIPVSGGEIFASSYGAGPAVVFLHGGPGDTHHYMKRMAEPLFGKFQCIFFDQRGTGRSTLWDRSPGQFRLELLFQDLVAVQNYFSTGPVRLVGHSWGAMYALFACIHSPSQFVSAALLNMGPLDSEMESATSKHLVSVLTDPEKQLWQQLRAQRNTARDRRDMDAVLKFDHELMGLRVKAWVHNPALRNTFLTDYFQDPPPDRDVNKWIWENAEGWFRWQSLPSTPTRTWLCVGENDSVPVAQAERVCQMMPFAQLSVLPNCGHIPWLEHPSEFYSQLVSFLREELAP